MQQPPEEEPCSRVVLQEGDISCLTAPEWQQKWRQQELYVINLERNNSQNEGELLEIRQQLERMKTQLLDSQQREKVLVRRLTAKEQETQDYVCQLNELKLAHAPTPTALRSALLDPAVNSLLQQMRTELQALRLKLEDTQNELAAWKFTPDSNTGKRLMAKCRLLYQENEELGKITSSGRLAKLESDLALQKSFSEEVRQSQNELDSFLADLDEDVEGMQSTILFLQQELKKSKDNAITLQKDLQLLKQTVTNGTNTSPNIKANGDNTTNNSLLSDVTTQIEGDQQVRTSSGQRVKRVRRSSVLSIDYNDEDALVIGTNGDAQMSSDPE